MGDHGSHRKYPKDLFKIVRHGRNWAVRFNSDYIRSFPTKRRAIRWMESQAVVEMHWRDYLAMPTHRRSDGITLIREETCQALT